MSVSVPVDGEGFLINRDDWSEEVAIQLAKADDSEVRTYRRLLAQVRAGEKQTQLSGRPTGS